MSRINSHILSCHLSHVSHGENGNAVLEAVFGIAVSVIMLSAVFSMYCKIGVVGNMTQAQSNAQYVAQECIDQLRALPFATVYANSSSGGTTHYAQIDQYAQTADALFPRPLYYDSTLTYTSLPANLTQAGVQASNYRFQTASNGAAVDNQVIVTTTQTATNIVTVTVTIHFLDTSGGAMKTYTTTSYITNNGLNG